MKRTYVKPTMDMEQFAANQYVAACAQCINPNAIGTATFAGFVCDGTHNIKAKIANSASCTSVHKLTGNEIPAHQDVKGGYISGYLSEKGNRNAHFMVPLSGDNANASN